MLGGGGETVHKGLNKKMGGWGEFPPPLATYECIHIRKSSRLRGTFLLNDVTWHRECSFKQNVHKIEFSPHPTHSPLYSHMGEQVVGFWGGKVRVTF